MLTGADSLTASERRVAEMAAEGLTSRAIAEQLFVTHKTIETHLGHIYRKLDIPGRRHIAEALGKDADHGRSVGSVNDRNERSGAVPDAGRGDAVQSGRDRQPQINEVR